MRNEGENSEERVELVPTSWSGDRLFFVEAKCSVCSEVFGSSSDGSQKPSDRERQVRAEFVDHVYAKHKKQ